MSIKHRMAPRSRKSALLAAAMPLAEQRGCHGVTAVAAAAAAEVNHSTLLYHFGSMDGFRRKLMLRAVREENLIVIARGLSVDDPIAQSISGELRDRAIAAMVNAMARQLDE